jgi:Mannosyltransferase putative
MYPASGCMCHASLMRVHSVLTGWRRLPAQVLLLDADNLPLHDPTHLFESPQMKQQGVMTWLDLWSPSLSSTTFVGHNSVYPLLGLRRDAYLVCDCTVTCDHRWRGTPSRQRAHRLAWD